MSTYADWYNQQQSLNSNSSSTTNSAPIRLTICKGDYIVDQDGNFSYEEIWEQEEIIQAEDEESNTEGDEIDNYLNQKIQIQHQQEFNRESNAIEKEVESTSTFQRLALGETQGALQTTVSGKPALLVIDT